MNIIFDSQTFSFNDWQPPLQQWLPAARFFAAHEAPPNPDYALLWKPHRLDWSGFKSLKGAIALGAGLDGFTQLQLPAGITLQRLSNAGMQTAMSEYVHYGVLYFQRGFNHYLTAEQPQDWTPLDYKAPADTAVGILGLGSLGEAVATHLARQGYSVSGWSRTEKNVAGVSCLYGLSGLRQLLPRCNILVNLLPLTAQTKHLIDAEKFKALPPGAGFINASRGAVTIEEDLLDALHRGSLCGALLDVFEEEPLPPSHPFWQHPKIRITPHISAPTLINPAAKEVARIIQDIEAQSTYVQT